MEISDKISDKVLIAATVIGLPLLIVAGYMYLPSSGTEIEPVAPAKEAPRDTVNNDTENLLVDNHQLPKHRPPKHWDMVLQAGAGNQSWKGFEDGSMVKHVRQKKKEVVNASSNRTPITVIEQLTEKIFRFSSFRSAQRYYNETVRDVRSRPADVVFEKLDTESKCKGFYVRQKNADGMLTVCHYGNIVFEIESASTKFASKANALEAIRATESNF